MLIRGLPPAAAARAAAEWGLYLAFKALPVATASDVGAGLSFVPRRKFGPTHRDAKALIAALRPDWAADPVALEAAGRRAWANAARTIAEVTSCHRIVEQGRVRIENVELVDAAMASGRPCILLFVHTGNWEVSGIQLAFRYPGRIFAIIEPPKSASQAAILDRERRKMPADLVPFSPLIWRQVYTRLKQPGGILWISADDLTAGRVNAPLFGRAPRLDGNLGKVARLAMRTGAIIVPFYCERHADLRFTTHILPPLTFEGDSADEQAVVVAVETMDAIMTPPVIALVDQWLMTLFYRGRAVPPSGPAT